MKQSRATTNYHPARHVRKRSSGRGTKVVIPEAGDAEVQVEGRSVRLTHLDKVFWPQLGITKGDLLRYYARVAKLLLPHLHDRAMVMKRYPNGAEKEFFFMKRAPSPRPEWLDLCSIAHSSGNVIDFPVIQGLASLLWVLNLGCIDLNPWYARCDDVDCPDFLNFDLDPGPGAGFDAVRETALVVRDALNELGMKCYAKTSGSKGIHIYVPIVRGPRQHTVWQAAKAFAQVLAEGNSKLITAEYRVAKRPKGRVLVDYNQNAWGRTLASVYSVRPHPKAAVSAPVTWGEIEGGTAIEDFRIDNMSERLDRVGDLWKAVLSTRGRFSLERLTHAA